MVRQRRKVEMTVVPSLPPPEVLQVPAYTADEYASLSSLNVRERFVLVKLFADQRFQLDEWQRRKASVGLD